MGNEDAIGLKRDLIDLDIEEIRINRELYNLQMQMNAKLSKEKKVKIKKNYKQFCERKILFLEEKKRQLFENENNNNQNNQDNKGGNKMIYKVAETGEDNNKEINKNNNIDNKLSLISNSSKGNKNNSQKMIIDKNENNIVKSERKEMISNSEIYSKSNIFI